MDPRRWWRAWRASPRPPWWQGTRLHGLVALAAGGAWLAAAQGGWAVAAGGADPSGGRGLAAAAYTLVALLVAVSASCLVSAHLRRPVVDHEPALSPPNARERRLRDDAERLRWAPRAPHGDL